jgi:hypothetical protein
MHALASQLSFLALCLSLCVLPLSWRFAGSRVCVRTSACCLLKRSRSLSRSVSSYTDQRMATSSSLSVSRYAAPMDYTEKPTTGACPSLLLRRANRACVEWDSWMRGAKRARDRAGVACCCCCSCHQYLCWLKLIPETKLTHPPTPTHTRTCCLMQHTAFHKRDNVSRFIAWVRQLGVDEAVIFEADDLVGVSHRTCVRVCVCVCVCVYGRTKHEGSVAAELTRRSTRTRRTCSIREYNSYHLLLIVVHSCLALFGSQPMCTLQSFLHAALFSCLRSRPQPHGACACAGRCRASAGEWPIMHSPVLRVNKPTAASIATHTHTHTHTHTGLTDGV